MGISKSTNGVARELKRNLTSLRACSQEQAFFILELTHNHYQERKCCHGNKQTQRRNRKDVAIDGIDVDV
jgi:hypothetical protein